MIFIGICINLIVISITTIEVSKVIYREMTKSNILRKEDYMYILASILVCMGGLFFSISCMEYYLQEKGFLTIGFF